MIRLFKMKNKKGMTLVEVIVSIAILGIVLLAITMFFLTSNRISIINSNQRDVQSEVRLAVDQVLMDIRYAREIELLTASEAITQKSTSNYNYIYFTGSSIYRSTYDAGTRTDRILTGEFVNGASSIQKVSDTGIRIIISSEKRNQNFDLDSTIILPNLVLEEKVVTGAGVGTAVKYKL